MCYDEIWLHASFFTEKAKIDCASWLVPFNRIELNTVNRGWLLLLIYFKNSL